jgi:hypothetical protein
MIDVLCWHRLRVRASGLQTCLHCGVPILECPCVRFRVPDGKCCYCEGSGWVAEVRGRVQRFRELCDIAPPPVAAVEDWVI